MSPPKMTDKKDILSQCLRGRLVAYFWYPANLKLFLSWDTGKTSVLAYNQSNRAAKLLTGNDVYENKMLEKLTESITDVLKCIKI